MATNSVQTIPTNMSSSVFASGVVSTDKKVTINQRTIYSSEKGSGEGIVNSAIAANTKSKDEIVIDQKVQSQAEALLGPVWDFAKSFLNPLMWLNTGLAKLGFNLTKIQPAIEAVTEPKATE